MLLHETVVAWVRKYFRKHPYRNPHKTKAQNYQAFLQCLRDAEAHINRTYDVAGLCASFPARIDDLIKARGDRLRY